MYTRALEGVVLTCDGVRHLKNICLWASGFMDFGSAFSSTCGCHFNGIIGQRRKGWPNLPLCVALELAHRFSKRANRLAALYEKTIFSPTELTSDQIVYFSPDANGLSNCEQYATE